MSSLFFPSSSKSSSSRRPTQLRSRSRSRGRRRRPSAAATPAAAPTPAAMAMTSASLTGDKPFFPSSESRSWADGAVHLDQEGAGPRSTICMKLWARGANEAAFERVCKLALACASLDSRLFKSSGPHMTEGGEMEFMIWILPPPEAVDNLTWNRASDAEFERLQDVLRAALPDPSN